jgi:hypothetical protein
MLVAMTAFSLVHDRTAFLCLGSFRRGPQGVLFLIIFIFFFLKNHNISNNTDSLPMGLNKHRNIDDPR